MAVGFQLGAVAAGAGRLVSRLRRLLGGIRTAISRIPLTSAYGRMTAMHTTRSPAEITSAADIFTLSDRTTWSYDQSTGLLTNKGYANGKGTAYTYTPDGKLAARLWARGVATTYAYTNGSSLVAIDYSDDTPDVSFQYDRLGRMTLASDGVATRSFDFDAYGALASESVSGPYALTLTRNTDAFGRPAGIDLSDSPYSSSYAYDAYGRFTAVTSQVHILTHGFTYGYLSDTDLIETMANSHGHTVTRTYDPVMPHITGVHNGFTGGRTISQYDYTYDALGRRTAIANSGEAFTFSNANDLAAFNLYGYNGRSEVTSAARYWGTDTGTTTEPVAGQEYAYAYDPIGNRITSAEGDTDRTATYTANALNQYTRRTVPGVKELAGTAITNATVTVNGLATDRHGPWWRHALEVNNAAAATYTQAVVCAVYNPPGTNNPDVVTSATGHVFVAQTPETFTYDDDGNLLSDGRFNYAWDAENRLISVETATNLPAAVPRIRLTHAYDYQSRRLATAREEWNGSAWQSAGTNRYVYDGWNVVAETWAASPANTNYYVWGLDLSGTLQGAGGIGGLLATSLDGTTAFYCHDANGNVGQLVDASSAILAHYEYSPFGETIVSTGPFAKVNPFRFSTKWFDNDTGLGDWGYRWYSPGMGRWVSRDPIGERGGINVLTAMNNNPACGSDYLGLVKVAWPPPGWEPIPPDWMPPVIIVLPPLPPPSKSAPEPCTIELWCWPAFGVWGFGKLHCEYKLSDASGDSRCRGEAGECENNIMKKCCPWGCATATTHPKKGMGKGAYVAETRYLSGSACKCLRNNCDNYPTDSCYKPFPKFPASANSNTVAACLNSKCNLGFANPGGAPGWGHGKGCPVW
jgi:RHS repeat-associated protein